MLKKLINGVKITFETLKTLKLKNMMKKYYTYTMCRATNCSRFMHDIKGSSEDYSFKLVAENESKSVHLFEILYFLL